MTVTHESSPTFRWKKWGRVGRAEKKVKEVKVIRQKMDRDGKELDEARARFPKENEE